jgi:hypothetical protein
VTFEKRLEQLERRFGPPVWAHDPERERIDREWAFLRTFLEADPEAAQLYHDCLLRAAEYAGGQSWGGDRLFEAVGLDPEANELAHRLLERLAAYEERVGRRMRDAGVN